MPAEKTELPNILCPLLNAVFVAVLRRLHTAFFYVDYEADRAIAELAIKYQCPAMSADSDFFIFTDYWGDCGGYCCIQPIPFNASPKAFENKVCEACALGDFSRQNQRTYCYYLEAKCFTPDQGAFSRLAAPLRPVFAVLWGNDYVPSGYFYSCLPDWITRKVDSGRKFGRQKMMENLIEWLSSFGSSLQKPISYVLSRFPPNEKLEAEEAFYKGLSLYSVDLKSALERYGKYIGLAAPTTRTDRSRTAGSTTRTSYGERARQVLLGQGNHVIRELTENWPTALVEYFRTHPTFGLFNPVYSFDHLCGSGVQDMRQPEPPDICSRNLRQLLYSVLFHIEGNNRRDLHGVRGTSSNPHVFETKINEQMEIEVTTVKLLKLTVTTPRRLLRMCFGLPCNMPDTPEWLHGLACACFIVLQSNQKKQQQESGGEPITMSSSPTVLATLAFSLVAFALQGEETPQGPSTEEVLLGDRISQGLGLLDCPDSAEACLNFEYVHTYAQLQIAYSTLVTLGGVLTATMPSKEHVDLGSLNEVSFCFPSGRLVHRLAVRLGLLPQCERQKEVCEVIFPRLLEANPMKKDSPPCLTQNALCQLTSNYARIITFVDNLLAGRK
nr:unnamed protein product [Spirometra erinaceieuropaei]